MNLELLGTHNKKFDIYIDRDSGKIYKRKILLIRGKNGRVDIAESEMIEMEEGRVIYDPFKNVLSRDN